MRCKSSPVGIVSNRPKKLYDYSIWNLIKWYIRHIDWSVLILAELVINVALVFLFATR